MPALLGVVGFALDGRLVKDRRTLDILGTYNTKWTTTPDLDMDAEIESLREAIQAVWDS